MLPKRARLHLNGPPRKAGVGEAGVFFKNMKP
jgi:hypothetical protein